MILERFDAIVFIGDDSLRHVYAAFNMLIREDIATGGLDQHELTESDQTACRCDNQFMRLECSSRMATDSKTLSENIAKAGHKSPYYCNRKSYSTLAKRAMLTS